MSLWYYADRQRQRQGPVSGDELRGLVQGGQLDGDTLVWREGLQQWQRLEGFAAELGLRSASAAAPAHALEEPAPVPAADSGETAWSLDAAQAVPADSGPALDARMAVSADSPYLPPAAPLASVARVVAGGEVIYAGFWKRVAASLIDGLIVGVIGGVLGTLVGGLLGMALSVSLGDYLSGGGPFFLQIITNLISIGATAAYYAGFHSARVQATPGKMAVGIKVVRSDGHPITLARGIGRYFATWISYLTLAIGFLMAAFTDRKRALHDMICDTLVVDRWAFTDHPEWQRPGLGAVTVVTLILGGLLLLGLLAAVIVAGVALAPLLGP